MCLGQAPVFQYSCAGFSTQPRCPGFFAILHGSRLRILVSNDDGYRAEGLQHLVSALTPLADVAVVAPDRNRSGASNSLTLDVPLRALPFGDHDYFVNGTPTDCVYLAISGLFDLQHDMVVSGINDGANLGDGLYVAGDLSIRDCTIADNDGEGLYYSSGAIATTNAIFWGNGDDLRYYPDDGFGNPANLSY